MSSMTCQHSDELLTLGAMQLLSAEEQARLDAQVNACPACRERFQEYRALAALMPQLVRLETAPSKALNGQASASANRNGTHPPAFFETDAEGEEPASGGPAVPERPIVISLPPRRARASQRLIKVMSGLAAAILLIGIIGGFWLLLISRTQTSHKMPNVAQPTQQTVITYNPCSAEIAKGVQVGNFPPCALLVMDYSRTPAALEEIDPTTGNLLGGITPLPVGNALLASLSADRLTLALGILPQDSASPTYLQMVRLDTWKLGAKQQMRITSTENLLDLAITPDGTGIYVLLDDYTHSPSQATLQRYTYDRGRDTLKFSWSAPLSFAAGKGTINDGSFALSTDGKTAYIYSATTTPPQLAAVPLKANGLGTPRVLPLPSIANGAEPPFGNENYTYKPGDPIYQWYQPAIMFVPQRSTLYLVHAEASDPSKDVLTLIDLTTFSWKDLIVHNAGQALADITRPAQNSNLSAASAAILSSGALSAMSSRPLTLQPQPLLRPYKGVPYNGRDEVGAVSPDGRWVYLSVLSSTPTFNSSGAWTGEQQTGSGLLKIDTQTGQVVGRWFTGAYYTSLTFGQDGQDLYLFGPPPGTQITNQLPPFELLVFDTQQEKLVSAFSNIEGGWFILTLP